MRGGGEERWKEIKTTNYLVYPFQFKMVHQLRSHRYFAVSWISFFAFYIKELGLDSDSAMALSKNKKKNQLFLKRT